MSDEAGMTGGGNTPISLNDAVRLVVSERSAPPKDDKTPAETAPETAAPLQAQESTSQEGDATPAEEAGSETATDANDAASEVPPIEKPRSLPKEMDDLWAALPRDQQERLAGHLRERDTSTDRKLQEVAEERKATMAERQAAAEERQRLAGVLAAANQMLETEGAEKFPDIKTFDDYQRLANQALALWESNPFDAGRIQNYLKAYDVHMQKVAAVQTERNKIAQQQSEERNVNLRKYESDELLKVVEVLPDLKDPAKLQARINDGIAYLKENFKYTVDDIRQFATESDKPFILTAAYQLMADKAMKYDAIQKAKTEVLKKDVPVVQRPGTSRQSGEARSDQIQALDNRLTRSGSLKDAVALLQTERAATRRRA